MRVAVQPCSNLIAYKHYQDTIQKIVPSSKILPYLAPDQAVAFQQRFPQGAAVWGVTEGVAGGNKKKWARLEAGDLAVLYRDKRLFSQARIALCMHNAALATELWSTDAEGKTWEYLYFLDELEEIDVPVTQFNAALGYKANNIVQGFNVYEGEQAAAVLDLLDMSEATTDLGQLPTGTPLEALNNLAELDLPTSSKRRVEAGIFRRHLFGNDVVGHCDLCGRSLPVNLLVAAHIKPRASATDQERRDPNIVMSACRLGCDDLFERGYIRVTDSGKVSAHLPAKVQATALGTFVTALIGRACQAFRPETQSYFAWRWAHPRRYI